MIRSFIFHLLYWKNKLCMRNIKMKGYCVIFRFSDSYIKIGGGCYKFLIHKQYVGIMATDHNCSKIWRED